MAQLPCLRCAVIDICKRSEHSIKKVTFIAQTKSGRERIEYFRLVEIIEEIIRLSLGLEFLISQVNHQNFTNAYSKQQMLQRIRRTLNLYHHYNRLSSEIIEQYNIVL